MCIYTQIYPYTYVYIHTYIPGGTNVSASGAGQPEAEEDVVSANRGEVGVQFCVEGAE
jgi:hypothetical protein